MSHDDRDRLRRRSAVVHYSSGEFADDVPGDVIAVEMADRLRVRAAVDPDATPAERDLFRSVAQLLEGNP